MRPIFNSEVKSDKLLTSRRLPTMFETLTCIHVRLMNRAARPWRRAGRPPARGATGAWKTGRWAVRSSQAGITCLLLIALIAACGPASDEPLAEIRPPYARFELNDRAAAGYALDSLLDPPLLAPAGARCPGIFTIEKIDADTVILRLSEAFDDGGPSRAGALAGDGAAPTRQAAPGDGASGDAGRAIPREVAEHLLDLLDPLDLHPEAFRLYFIAGAADYARGHAPAHRVGIDADNERLLLRRADARDVTVTARPGEIATRLAHPAFSPPRESAESERVRTELRRRGAAVVSLECAGEVTVEIAVRGAGAGSGAPAVETTVGAPGTAYDILVANTSASADGMPAESGYSGERYGGSAAPIEAGSTAAGDSTAPGDSTAETSPALAPLADLESRREVMRIARAALDRSASADRFERVANLGNTTSVGALSAVARLAGSPATQPNPAARGAASEASRAGPTRFAALPEASEDRPSPLRLIAAPPLVSALEPLADALAAHDLEVSHALRGGPSEYTDALFRGDFDLALIRWESESGGAGEILRLFRPYDPRNFTGSGAPESFEAFARELHEVDFALYVNDDDDVDGRAEAIERFGSPRVSPYGVPYF